MSKCCICGEDRMGLICEKDDKFYCKFHLESLENTKQTFGKGDKKNV